MEISVVIPARNEGESLKSLIPKIQKIGSAWEIIVVDDGSTDDTAQVCLACDIKLVRHQYSIGNGAAIKSGARAATGNILVFMDGDGQHNPEDIPRLLDKLNEGFDMVVGARQSGSQASVGRGMANGLYNWLASYMTNQIVEDLTSGFRVARNEKFQEFIHLLPNGFSYPTTITMAFFRAGYAVAYEPIQAAKRIGTSHIRPLKDGIRFLLIIFRIGTLYSPLKLFVPVSLFYISLGIGYYIYTFGTMGKLSIMTVFLLTAGTTVFLIGLVSEQITQLMYKPLASTDKGAMTSNQ